MALFHASFEQTAVVAWMDEIEVPDEIVKEGKKAIRGYISACFHESAWDYGADFDTPRISFESADYLEEEDS